MSKRSPNKVQKVEVASMKFASIFLPQDTVSVHRPGFYAHRFLDFCADRVFKKIPSREYCKAAARISNSSSETSPFICVFSPPFPPVPNPIPPHVIHVSHERIVTFSQH